MIKRLMRSFTALYGNQGVRFVGRTLYYLAIIVGLVALYGRGNFSTPKFIYQGF